MRPGPPESTGPDFSTGVHLAPTRGWTARRHLSTARPDRVCSWSRNEHGQTSLAMSATAMTHMMSEKTTPKNRPRNTSIASVMA